MPKKDAILLAANFSNKTGYAWNNIYKLFNVISRQFLHRGYAVVCSFSKIEGSIHNFDSDLNLAFIEYDITNRSLTNTFKLLRIIKRYRIKYLYLTDQRAFDYRYAMIRLTGAKKIIVHNRVSVADPYPAPYQSGIKGTIKSILGSWHLITADRIYAVSEFVRNRLIMQNRIPPSRVVKILNGIDTEKFKPSLKKENTINEKPLKIFSGGRATSHKGIHILIEAVSLLRLRTNKAFEVRYAGDGPEFDSLQKLAKQHKLGNYFLFLGQLDSTSDEVLAADIIVVPSIWGDACPSAVSEALAAGKPLIATAVGGVPEIVGKGDNAILIPPGDPEKLCTALENLIDSKVTRLRMSKKARYRAECILNLTLYHNTVIEQLINDLVGSTKVSEHDS